MKTRQVVARRRLGRIANGGAGNGFVDEGR
jgi:hypothetical protein